MATVRDLSGNTNYLDEHIPTPGGSGGGGSGDASAANQLEQIELMEAVVAGVDGLETLMGTNNTSLGTINTSIAATNTAIGTSNTHLAAIETAAESTTPVLVSEVAYDEARVITPNTNVAPGQGVMIVCTVAGVQKLELDGGDVISVDVVVGTSYINNIAVIDAPTSGTTATCVVTVLGTA